MDKRSIGQIFMFFNFTMARDIPRMGKILKLYILEILGHPNKTCVLFDGRRHTSSVLFEGVET